MTYRRSLRYLLVFAAGAMVTSLACTTARAQQRKTITITPSAYDRYEAGRAHDIKYHALPANTPAARSARRTKFSNMHPSAMGGASAPALEPSLSPEHGIRYPADLQYHGGNVVRSARQYLIYVNLSSNASCDTIATCWGNPSRFLHDLGLSDFIHVVDQYVGAQYGDRYRVSGDSINVNYPVHGKPLTDADIQTIVHAVVTALGLPTGYHAIYDVFLTPGQDECFSSADQTCYSPDNPATFYFCAYHGSTDFSDIGHVLYTVEPAQNVDGCNSRPNGPNGPLADSTNSTLSHETFETITDPDGTGWWNELDNGLYGQEIADECSFLIFTPPPPALPGPNSIAYFDPSNVILNGHPYLAQPEYDNALHACATAPGSLFGNQSQGNFGGSG